MWQKQPRTKFGGSCAAQLTWLAWPNQLAAKVRVRFMVMVWLEGGQGEARGACPPPPQPTLPDPPPLQSPPPPGAFGPLLLGGGVAYRSEETSPPWPAAWLEGGGGGLSFESVVPGYKAALDSHDAVGKRYPGDALVEAATNPAFKPPMPAEAQGSGSSIGTASQ